MRSMLPPLLSPISRYTCAVLVGKRALWVLAALLTLAIIITAWVNGSEGGARLTLGSGTTSGKAQPALMLQPRYQGLDDDNQPFSVSADRATQFEQDKVLLEKISAEMTLHDGRWLALSAGSGVYVMDGSLLQLGSGVELFLDGGYEFRSQSAEVMPQSGEALGNEPVQGQGPLGTLQADRFKVLDRGQLLQFNDHVKMVLYL